MDVWRYLYEEMKKSIHNEKGFELDSGFFVVVE